MAVGGAAIGAAVGGAIGLVGGAVVLPDRVKIANFKSNSLEVYA